MVFFEIGTITVNSNDHFLVLKQFSVQKGRDEEIQERLVEVKIQEVEIQERLV